MPCRFSLRGAEIARHPRIAPRSRFEDRACRIQLAESSNRKRPVLTICLCGSTVGGDLIRDTPHSQPVENHLKPWYNDPAAGTLGSYPRISSVPTVPAASFAVVRLAFGSNGGRTSRRPPPGIHVGPGWRCLRDTGNGLIVPAVPTSANVVAAWAVKTPCNRYATPFPPAITSSRFARRHVDNSQVRS